VRGGGDQELVVWSLLNLGAAAHGAGHPGAARRHAEHALALARRAGYREGIAWALNLLGLVALGDGDGAGAAAALEQSLALHDELGDRWRAASVLEALAAVAGADGELEDAARLLGAADRVREAIGTPPPPVEVPERERVLARLRDGLDAEALDRAWSVGRALGLDAWRAPPARRALAPSA
jgi:tetratricopeptide (TPR) repeat protein